MNELRGKALPSTTRAAIGRRLHGIYRALRVAKARVVNRTTMNEQRATMNEERGANNEKR